MSNSDNMSVIGLNEVGRYFAEHENTNFSQPISYSTFVELGWDNETYINYLNCVDIVRSAFILARLDTDVFFGKQDMSLYVSPCCIFSDFLKSNTGISINPDRVLRSLIHFFNTVYFQNRIYYEYGTTIPILFLDLDIDKIQEHSPPCFFASFSRIFSRQPRTADWPSCSPRRPYQNRR